MMVQKDRTLIRFTRELALLRYGDTAVEQAVKTGRTDPEIIPRFIVIEGPDGAGGSTQARLLERYLQSVGLACECSTEPGDGRIGRHIRTLLQDRKNSEQGVAYAPEAKAQFRAEWGKLAQYFAADRAEHIWGMDGILAKTQAGMYCISERYLFSSLVYQGLSGLSDLNLMDLDDSGGSDGEAGTSISEIWELNRDFPLPQHFFYLDIAADLAEQRIARRETEEQTKREIFEQEGFLAQVRQAYLAVLEHFGRIAPGMEIHHLDANQSREVLQGQILQRLGQS
ncbi:thymidylate kinase [Candidatus Haliotispira prima]|uniref:Thymidylate kinase n=1 Tax=Candidatus Haliotispira prima TaxID=3034016 RepID=A0ABY8MMT6_9SPIO|nr:thymidylate kinase [Candidatus Haliotispira prima]